MYLAAPTAKTHQNPPKFHKAQQNPTRPNKTQKSFRSRELQVPSVGEIEERMGGNWRKRGGV
jgi:hypothetical protein